MRPSSSASARPGMTLTLLPAWTTVGLAVLRSTALSSRAIPGSRTPRRRTRLDQRGCSSSGQRGPAGPALEGGQRLQEPADLGRGVQGQLAPPDPGQELRQPDHGVVVAGDAAVPGGPGGRRPQPGDALLGHLDRVEGPAAQVEGGPADLPEGVAGPDLVGVVVDQPGAAGRAAGLLVGHRGQLEVAPQGHPEPGQQPDGGHAHGHHLLHVDRAPAPDGAVVDLAGERRVPPAPGLGRDHVDVAVEQQRGRVPVAAGQAGDQVGPARGRRQHLRLDPGPAQGVGQEGHALGLVAGRVGGVEPQQRPQQLHHRLALPLPVDLLQRRVHRVLLSCGVVGGRLVECPA